MPQVPVAETMNEVLFFFFWKIRGFVPTTTFHATEPDIAIFGGHENQKTRHVYSLEILRTRM